MKKFFIKIILIFVIFLGLDQIFGFAFKNIYNNVKSGTAYITNYAFRSSNEDILIFGASEVTHSINSNQIIDILGMTCYNLGMDGQSIHYQYALLTETLNRYRPKIIITSTLMLSHSQNSSLAALYPYYYDHHSVRNLINEVEPDAKYKLWIKSYVYNSSLLNVIQGNIVKEPNTNGYKPLYEIGKNMKLPKTPFKISISDETVEYFEKFLKSCLVAGIKVILVDPPRYYISSDTEEKKIIASIIKKYPVKYCNYSADTTFINHPELFKDLTHLNHEGAKILTNLLIKEIYKDIK